MTVSAPPQGRSAERIVFEIFLRTGRRLPINAARQALETKFNPWHDPNDGRFTFAWQGNYFPSGGHGRGERPDGEFRGRGGGFGGAGSSASWEPVAPKHEQPEAVPRPRPPVPEIRDPKPIVVHAPRRAAVDAEAPHKHISRNDYVYDIDQENRSRRITGELRLGTPEPRSKRAQADAGQPDRRPTDDGGHYIATRFGGPRDKFNHFAQDASFNRGAYRALEDSWAKTRRNGHRVFVDIVPHYAGSSQRPYSISVTWYVDGKAEFREFPNEKGR